MQAKTVELQKPCKSPVSLRGRAATVAICVWQVWYLYRIIRNLSFLSLPGLSGQSVRCRVWCCIVLRHCEVCGANRGNLSVAGMARVSFYEMHFKSVIAPHGAICPSQVWHVYRFTVQCPSSLRTDCPNKSGNDRLLVHFILRPTSLRTDCTRRGLRRIRSAPSSLTAALPGRAGQ